MNDDSHPLFARRLARGQLIMLDLAAGLSLALVFLTTAVNAGDLPPWVRIAVPLGLGLPLAIRRLFPLPIFVLTLALAVVAVLIGAVNFAYVSPAYALYLVAVSESRGTWLPTSAIGVVAAITGAGLVLAGGVPRAAAPEWLLGVDKMLIGIAALGGAWTVGRAMRERRIYAAHHTERMAAQAVAEERLRIARELHDVVTHNVGLIAVKAGVANHVLAARPEEAHDALRVIETASRSALVEMRHLLGVLRSADTPTRDPAPGIDGLDGLAEQARMAGVRVDLDVQVHSGGGGSWDRAGEPQRTGRGTVPGPGEGRAPASNVVPSEAQGSEVGERGRVARSRAGRGDSAGVRRLPEGVELSVYRIVQEALTNVVKHAAPARCWVSVVDDGGSVRIEVRDDGPGQRTLPGEGVGHGLIGMRERVMMYGGAFEAGGLPKRGFRVSAVLPYGRAS
ncbi:sensor histidine kinase [Nonomuraea sp. LPB2021202275-12-8]|uniref:sensor histidine kinase n=1 Tax=Nonomuraea sp. LPB2021202275-12-8 TaxID=3120159 RepID=UPI00300D02BA